MSLEQAGLALLVSVLCFARAMESERKNFLRGLRDSINEELGDG